MEILNSPSVLRPIFDEFKARKPSEVAKGMRPELGQSAITVKEKRAPVLNVKFRDTDKQMVLPITEMTSKATRPIPTVAAPVSSAI